MIAKLLNPAIVKVSPNLPHHYQFRLKDYAILLKPHAMSLVLFTASADLLLTPGGIAAETGLIAVVCIAAGAITVSASATNL